MKYKKITFILSVIIFLFAQKISTAQIVKTFNYTGSLQPWSVPSCVSAITINCYGAQGGSANNVAGGLGAEMIGTFTVTPGQVLSVVVGEQGATAGAGLGSGGGAGSGVVYNGTAWIIAGGGAGRNGGGYADADATTSNNGQPGSGNANGGTGGGDGGSIVYCSPNDTAYGGKGFNSGNNGSTGGNGYSAAPCLTTATNGVWGLGGGGGGVGASKCNCGGGGGGYSGGGGGGINGDGGGGGSYNIGSNQNNRAGIQSGDGLITITYISDTVGTVNGHIISNVSCHGGSDGVVSAMVTGASSVYTYSWAPAGGSKDTATGLSAGTYTITVHNPCGHPVSATVTISQPASAVSATATILSNVSCNGGYNGTGTAGASGGTGPYHYSWAPAGGTSSIAFGLTAGTYTLTATDSHGCTATASINITQPNAVAISANITANVLCNGSSTGSATSLASGGVSPYIYSWSPAGGSANVASGLAAGTYTVTVSDSCSGSATASVNITQPNGLFVSAGTQNNVICNGDNTGTVLATVQGGNPPYTYAWTGGQTNAGASSLAAGSYTVSVTDANGCTYSASTGVTQPSAITIVPNMKPDNGNGTGSAWVSVGGGVSPYAYLWKPGGNTTDSISHDTAGKYCCHITDANGCIDSTCITIQSDAGITGIDNGTEQIAIYPNPNKGVFALVIASEAKQSPNTVEVYNVLGEKVYFQLSIMNYPLSIDLSSQPNGVYLYRVKSSENGNLLGEGKLVIAK